MRRIVITGGFGYSARWLAQRLARRGDVKLVGLVRGHPPREIAPYAEVHRADLADSEALAGVLQFLQPDEIYHLAAYVDPGKSFSEPAVAWRDNLTATQALYDAAAQLPNRPRILFVSTGAVYGEPRRSDDWFHERSELRPLSPYATSKAAADLLSYQAFRSQNLPIIRVRPFNFIGPGQSERFALSGFAAQIAAIERGDREAILSVGNLDSERDILDVRDVVAAYELLMTHGAPGEAYNLARGQAFSMRRYLDALLAASPVSIRVEIDPARFRKVETATVRVDVQSLQKATGWQPTISVPTMMADLLAAARHGSAVA